MADAVNLAVGRYDVWAKWLMLALVVDFKTAEAFQTQLTAWRGFLEELVEPKLEPSLRTTFRIRLYQRSAHWMSQASQLARMGEPPLSPPSERVAVNWRDIEIVFLSDVRVQVFVPNRVLASVNYAEMGFQDGRTEMPTLAWAVLRSLARDGTVRWNPNARLKAADSRVVVERRVQEVRRGIKKYLKEQGLDVPDTDPLPIKKRDNNYQALFRIRQGASAET